MAETSPVPETPSEAEAVGHDGNQRIVSITYGASARCPAPLTLTFIGLERGRRTKNVELVKRS